MGEAAKGRGDTRLGEDPLCPDCGTRLSDEPWATGLCLACMVRMSIGQPSMLAELGAEAAAEPADQATLASPRQSLESGQILGGRYRIRTLLGRGGMGEVWRAFDLKLRVDVALKALRPALLESPRALETLRQEVRTAREVVSPNVCRVFDLVELEGHELVSMEYIDGDTLHQLLEERSPLDLSEARDLAAQMLAGLEAIHEAQLVHRDMKPENVMLTRAGRVVVMDFGIAGALVGEAADVAGTPAYMAPEQSKGETLDARTDVYAAGLVLAEMVESGGVRSAEQRRDFWQRCRERPPRLAKTPWAPVLGEALRADRQERPESAAALSRALEEATARAIEEGVEPYPGLASFTEADAEYFFGRELEVEAMWKKLRRLHLLGLIGPSGTGKTSFLRAGVLPARRKGWGVIFTTPGTRPATALAEALALELAGDTDAIRDLVGFDDPAKAVAAVKRWREKYDQCLIVIDQFEELFTQSSEETQERFAELLGRLSIEADVRILLSLRDDFLTECGRFPAFTPIFEALTVLNPLSGSALRRAVVQPGLKHGYRFEDDHLVEEILAEVEGERGALPLLAFAAAQLWEGRDRERGVLTRRTYEEIGGVAGALARHADATLEEVGEENVPVVRELFRRLVTAQRTRATWDREELLSAFEDREAAGRVLGALIDARLVTSYELPSEEEDAEPRRRVEIIHESLLRSWPRLVRWQTQDEDSAQLLDQLRQTALMWEERGRPDDLLWTGSAFKEFELWRERYSGGLSTLEEEFAGEMVALADRQRRRRRQGIAAAFILLFVVLGIVGGFWRSSEADARRAEASNLLALSRGRLSPDPALADPTGALAYAIKSLEVRDDPATRRVALEALWAGPLALHVAPQGGINSPHFSSDGRWLAPNTEDDPLTGGRLYRDDGTSHFVPYPPELVELIESGELGDSGRAIPVPGRSLFVLPYQRGFVVFQTPPEGRVLWWQRYEKDGEVLQLDAPNSRELVLVEIDQAGDRNLRVWPVEGGASRSIGPLPIGESRPRLVGSLMVFRDGERVCIREWETLEPAAVQCLEHPAPVFHYWLGPEGKTLFSSARDGRARRWQLKDGTVSWSRDVPEEVGPWLVTAEGRALGWRKAGPHGFVWELERPPEFEPLLFSRRQASTMLHEGQWSPDGRWLTFGVWGYGTTLWSADRRHPFVIRGNRATDGARFSPDGRAIAWIDDRLHRLSLDLSGPRGTELLSLPQRATSVAWHPDGRRILVGEGNGTTWLVDAESGDAVELPQTAEASITGRGSTLLNPYYVAFSPDGRLAAGGGGPELLVWDLESLEVRSFVPDEGERGPEGPFSPAPTFVSILFTPDSRKVIASEWESIRIWDLEDGSWSLLGEGHAYAITSDGKTLYASLGLYASFEQRPIEGGVKVYDLETGESRVLPNHPRAVGLALDPTEQIIVTGDDEGVIRVGPVTGEEPHLLLGHQGGNQGVDVSPDGEWIVSADLDGSVRLWPMPDISRPPLHTLPRDELIAFLKRLTNFRAVEDPESDTGFSMDYDPFPGWADYPDWLPLAKDADESMVETSGGAP